MNLLCSPIIDLDPYTVKTKRTCVLTVVNSFFSSPKPNYLVLKIMFHRIQIKRNVTNVKNDRNANRKQVMSRSKTQTVS